MKSLILVGSFLLAHVASANTFYCIGNYFNGTKGKHTLTGSIASATSIRNVKLTVDDVVYFRADKLKKNPGYNPTEQYKNYISLTGKTEDQTDVGQFAVFGVLFEENFKSVKKFKAVVTTRQSDGGSYNKFNCYNNPK